MELNSLIFIFMFLPAVLFLTPIFGEYRKFFIVFVGFIFYFFGVGDLIFILFLSIGINHIFGMMIGKIKKGAVAKKVLVTGIIFNVLLLVFYKYSAFILRNIESVLGDEILWLRSVVPTVFPVGISFFTFVAISYLVDVYRDKKLTLRSPVDVAFIFSFFPKVFSGPISIHNKFHSELFERRGNTSFNEGAKRFVYGLGKKVLIADVLAKCVNGIFLIPGGELTFGLAWVGVLTFTLQIYMDFSGYTDMAIGVGQMLGYNLPENFNYPYIATSIKDFWKRWHITLSNWLQIYIFLPIAYKVMRDIKSDYKFGIKVENFAYITASFITMLICGIWHGAEWTFLVWGMFHGMFLIVEHWKLGKFMKKKVWKPLRILYAFTVVVVGWAIFRSPDMPYATELLKSMVGFGNGDGARFYPSLYFTFETFVVFLAGIVVSIPIVPRIRGVLDKMGNSVLRTNIGRSVLILSESVAFLFFITVFILSVISVIGGTYSPFIYFRF